jgi:hypothetical protein
MEGQRRSSHIYHASFRTELREDRVSPFGHGAVTFNAKGSILGMGAFSAPELWK